MLAVTAIAATMKSDTMRRASMRFTLFHLLCAFPQASSFSEQFHLALKAGTIT
jgi:hypothetical protein